MANIETVSLISEADAWNFLELAVKDLLPDTTLKIEFGNWAEFRVKFEGNKYNSSMNAGMMEAFIELQKNIYRLYSKLKYDDGRATHLTDDDRSALDIMVKVSAGSTDLVAMLQESLQKLVEGAIHKMEAKHYVILAVSGAVLFSGNTMWKNYLQVQSESKKAELHVALSMEETKHLQILSDAVKQVPHVAVITGEADEFRNKVLKSAKSADSIHIAGQRISRDQVIQIVRSSRSHSEEIRLDGEYRIVKVDSSNPDYFKVFLVGKDGKGFPAVLDDQTITKAKNRELLQEAEWDKKTIHLMINGTQTRGEVSSARIIDVKERFSPEA